MPEGSNGQTAELIKPSVGRIVHFVPGRNQCITLHGNKPLAAQIAHVFSYDCVNLAVLDSNGRWHNCSSVPLLQPGKPPPQEGYYCCWMDYQLGQAAMTAEIAERAGLTTDAAGTPGSETDAATEPGSPTDAATEPGPPATSAEN